MISEPKAFELCCSDSPPCGCAYCVRGQTLESQDVSDSKMPRSRVKIRSANRNPVFPWSITVDCDFRSDLTKYRLLTRFSVCMPRNYLRFSTATTTATTTGFSSFCITSLSSIVNSLWGCYALSSSSCRRHKSLNRLG